MTNETLDTFDLMITMNPQFGNDELNDKKKENALIKFIQDGKGILTLHSGTYLYKNWPWWTRLEKASVRKRSSCYRIQNSWTVSFIYPAIRKVL